MKVGFGSVVLVVGVLVLVCGLGVVRGDEAEQKRSEEEIDLSAPSRPNPLLHPNLYSRMAAEKLRGKVDMAARSVERRAPVPPDRFHSELLKDREMLRKRAEQARTEKGDGPIRRGGGSVKELRHGTAAKEDVVQDRQARLKTAHDDLHEKIQRLQQARRP